MNIFLAGIHGVGKTYLATRLPTYLGLVHTSASKLIREERALASWDRDKRVAEIDENQVALARAVRRYNDAGTRLLLDGHFVLLDTQGIYTPLGAEAFEPLNLDAVLLLEADPDVIINRTNERDQVKHEEKDVAAFMAEERRQAQAVSDELNVALEILPSPDLEAFIDLVSRLISRDI